MNFNIIVWIRIIAFETKLVLRLLVYPCFKISLMLLFLLFNTNLWVDGREGELLSSRVSDTEGVGEMG